MNIFSTHRTAPNVMSQYEAKT